jgi:hypothetical protein
MRCGSSRCVPRSRFAGTAELIAEGDYVVGQWKGGETHTGSAFDHQPLDSRAGGTTRAEALSDGVFVIATTVVVLDLRALSHRAAC